MEVRESVHRSGGGGRRQQRRGEERRVVCKYWKILQCEKFSRRFEDA
jgi:hypothetical protein